MAARRSQRGEIDADRNDQARYARRRSARRWGRASSGRRRLDVHHHLVLAAIVALEHVDSRDSGNVRVDETAHAQGVPAPTRLSWSVERAAEQASMSFWRRGWCGRSSEPTAAAAAGDLLRVVRAGRGDLRRAHGEAQHPGDPRTAGRAVPAERIRIRLMCSHMAAS